MTTEHQSGSLMHGKRKEEHLSISLNGIGGFKGVTSGFEEYRFIHQALPEIDLDQVELSTRLFGKTLAAPIIISPMLGGIEAATRINHNLAQAAQTLGLAMGVGSERCLIDEPETGVTYQVRDIAPDILLFANLGAVQLNYGYGVTECVRAIESIKADALILHLNPLQEALQSEGNSNFAGLLDKIKVVCRELAKPVIVKEVGCGISEEVAGKLAEAGVAGIDVAGAGGTSWSEIERNRTHDRLANKVAGDFSSWGIPTAESLVMAHKGAPDLTLIASGGIRTGIDVAKAIALGASAAGIAAPLLEAANTSVNALEEALMEIIEVLRIAMFCIGAGSIKELKMTRYLEKG